jgi:hypothetical protein
MTLIANSSDNHKTKSDIEPGNCSAGAERAQLAIVARSNELPAQHAPVSVTDDLPEPGEPGYWSADNPDLVIPNQPATAIYQNPFGQVVIRQEDFLGDDDDVIHISPRNIPDLIARLRSFQVRSGQ